MSRRGPDNMHTAALQLALEIYAKMPLIPQSLFLNGANIEAHNGSTGTLDNGGHKVKAIFRYHAYGIVVCYRLSSTSFGC